MLQLEQARTQEPSTDARSDFGSCGHTGKYPWEDAVWENALEIGNIHHLALSSLHGESLEFTLSISFRLVRNKRGRSREVILVRTILWEEMMLYPTHIHGT